MLYCRVGGEEAQQFGRRDFVIPKGVASARGPSHMSVAGGSVGSGRGVELCFGRFQQLLPGLLELVDTVIFQHQEDVGEVDADGL